MKSNRQARHIMELDYKVSNIRKVVNKDDQEVIVTHRSGRHRRVE